MIAVLLKGVVAWYIANLQGHLKFFWKLRDDVVIVAEKSSADGVGAFQFFEETGRGDQAVEAKTGAVGERAVGEDSHTAIIVGDVFFFFLVGLCSLRERGARKDNGQECGNQCSECHARIRRL